MDAPTVDLPTSQLAQQGSRHHVINMDEEPQQFNGIIALAEVVETTEPPRGDTIDILDIQREMYDHA